MLPPSTLPRSEESPLRILHLEDSAADHLLVCNALKSLNFKAVLSRVETLADYISMLDTGEFDVVLADYHLPGFSALDAWAVTPEDFNGPFILLSGAIGEAAAVAAIHTGISDFLPKNQLAQLGRVLQRAVIVQRAAIDKRATEKELRESRLRLAQFAAHLQDKMELERAAISREIHDDIGGSLAAIKLDLAWLSRHCEGPQVQQHLETATQMLQHALGASQRIMHDLRPAILDQGLLAAAQWLADGLERRTGIKIRMTASQNTMQLNKEILLVAYRTLQEALTNISKHADCSLVKVDISDFDAVLTVEISDNGKGFSSAERMKSHAFGLRGLQERALSVGGWLDISSDPGRGTAIILSVPLAVVAQEQVTQGARH
jgi:signal transduction histidine kinase